MKIIYIYKKINGGMHHWANANYPVDWNENIPTTQEKGQALSNTLQTLEFSICTHLSLPTARLTSRTNSS